eukprot:TRINITY_DN7928_c0_g1_i4.p2 TRINITY_DN7928_c0_g1~~TRINITY_DN7928_c0_g1_i4.p2  ORF type:complete len:133 (+),score=53.07 TRINITY_DN7928_c0_g1_i4:425-823(+)
MVEELRQEFLQTFPELAKSPHSNAPFSADKRYLNGLCKKYNDLSGNRTLEEAKGKVEGAKTIMKENVISLMGNKEQVAKLEVSTSEFAGQAKRFDESSHLIAQNYRWEQIKFWGVMICVVVCFIVFIMWYVL